MTYKTAHSERHKQTARCPSTYSLQTAATTPAQLTILRPALWPTAEQPSLSGGVGEACVSTCGDKQHSHQRRMLQYCTWVLNYKYGCCTTASCTAHTCRWTRSKPGGDDRNTPCRYDGCARWCYCMRLRLFSRAGLCGAHLVVFGRSWLAAGCQCLSPAEVRMLHVFCVQCALPHTADVCSRIVVSMFQLPVL